MNQKTLYLCGMLVPFVYIFMYILGGALRPGYSQIADSVSELLSPDAPNKLLLDIIQNDPYQNPPPYENLVGDLSGAYSRRINIRHRLVYQIYEKERTIKVIRLWTHYE